MYEIIILLLFPILYLAGTLLIIAVLLGGLFAIGWLQSAAVSVIYFVYELFIDAAKRLLRRVT